MRLGRICPEISADLVFAPLEWKPSYALLDKKIPTLNAALRILAILRGVLGRKSDGDPGAKSIWLGFQRIQDCVYGIHIANKLKGLI